MNNFAIAKWYLSLAPAFAPTYWCSPEPLERARMEYEDELAGGFLKWFPNLDLQNKDVFDIGCGYGGRTVRYAESGARWVTGLEVSDSAVAESREFARSRGASNTNFVAGTGESLPFSDASFDIITSYDVFEHVCDLRQTLLQCLRVLRPTGKLYAVFPPFYHPTGAHLEGWLSRMPCPNVFFSPQTLIRAGYEMLDERKDAYRPNPLRPLDKLWSLNGATVRSTRKLLASLGCTYDLRLAPIFSHLNSLWRPWRMKYYAWAFAPVRHIPLLNEVFTHRMVLTVGH
jgi:SAM-dependent methyltransferase